MVEEIRTQNRERRFTEKRFFLSFFLEEEKEEEKSQREKREQKRDREERRESPEERMKLWKRAAAAIKDRKSLLAVGLSRRTSYRNADLESAIIHATSHDSTSVDYSNAHRVYKWIRASPLNLKTLVNALSTRVDHTRSWIVALKSLMLLHGVLCCKPPSVVGEIRRLPFDLSIFTDGHSCLSKTWGFNIFVRAYYNFLHHYSLFLSDQIHRHRVNRRSSSEKADYVIQELERIQKLQSLLDLGLQIRPIADNMKKTLILEAMDCIVIESLNIYGRICSGIIKIIPSASKTEAAVAFLKIVQKATAQGEDLDIYFEFCKNFGVSNARETPQFLRIPEEEVETITKIVKNIEQNQNHQKKEDENEKNAIVVMENKNTKKLETIITEKWELFEDEYYCYFNSKEDKYQNPFMVSNQPLYIEYKMPDLITF